MIDILPSIENIQNIKKRIMINVPYKYRSYISYGVILFSYKTKRCVLVKRKHSFQFLVILSGNYRPSSLILLIPNITKTESKILLKCIFDKKIYVSYVKKILNYEINIDTSYEKLYENQEMIINLYERNSFDNDLKWNFPKGKLEYNVDKSILSCAYREFEEEIGVKIPDLIYISDTWIKTSFTSFDFKKIESKFIICFIEDEFIIEPINNDDEISDRGWFSLKEMKKMIKDDDFYKIVKTNYNLIINLLDESD